MEPKSIAFFTAVAVSILAVLSATTFPIAQATTNQAQSQAESIQENTPTTEDDSVMSEDTEPQEETTDDSNDDATEENTDAAESHHEAKDTKDEGRTGQSLGLDSNSGVVTCGQIVTEDVTLTSDLNCGSGDGLIVGTSGITINLNGYKITASDDADSLGLSMDYDGSSGILVANAEDVTISGLGEISNFDRGVTFMGSSGGQVADVQLANNGIGVLMSGSAETELSRNTITNNGIAVISDSSNGGVVAFNQVVANLDQGILLLGSDENVVAANNMFGNGDNGIYLDIMSNGNTVDYNTVFGHETADINNADGQPVNVNQNNFGENNNCGTSLPGGLCS